MNFRPTKKKVIVSVLIIVLIIIYGQISAPVCKPCAQLPKCVSYNGYSPFPKCGCNLCVSLIWIIGQWILVFLSGVLVYVIWSLFQKK